MKSTFKSRSPTEEPIGQVSECLTDRIARRDGSPIANEGGPDMATKKTTKAKSPTKAATKHPAAKKAKADNKLRLTSASPSFTVNDIEKSMAWYRDVLGFTVTERWEDGGKLLGAEMAAGDVSFMIGQDDWKKGRNRKKGEALRFYFMTKVDVNVLAAKLKSRGLKLDSEPETSEWGSHFGFSDPDGFKFTIAKEAKKKKK